MLAGGRPGDQPAQRMARMDEPITIKRYANERLYHPGAGAYVSLGDLAAMAEGGGDFVVLEAKTGQDITPSILRQIISERARHG